MKRHYPPHEKSTLGTSEGSSTFSKIPKTHQLHHPQKYSFVNKPWQNQQGNFFQQHSVLQTHLPSASNTYQVKTTGIQISGNSSSMNQMNGISSVLRSNVPNNKPTKINSCIPINIKSADTLEKNPLSHTPSFGVSTDENSDPHLLSDEYLLQAVIPTSQTINSQDSQTFSKNITPSQDEALKELREMHDEVKKLQKELEEVRKGKQELLCQKNLEISRLQEDLKKQNQKLSTMEQQILKENKFLIEKLQQQIVTLESQLVHKETEFLEKGKIFGDKSKLLEKELKHKSSILLRQEKEIKRMTEKLKEVEEQKFGDVATDYPELMENWESNHSQSMRYHSSNNRNISQVFFIETSKLMYLLGLARHKNNLSITNKFSESLSRIVANELSLFDLIPNLQSIANNEQNCEVTECALDIIKSILYFHDSDGKRKAEKPSTTNPRIILNPNRDIQHHPVECQDDFILQSLMNFLEGIIPSYLESYSVIEKILEVMIMVQWHSEDHEIIFKKFLESGYVVKFLSLKQSQIAENTLELLSQLLKKDSLFQIIQHAKDSILDEIARLICNLQMRPHSMARNVRQKALRVLSSFVSAHEEAMEMLSLESNLILRIVLLLNEEIEYMKEYPDLHESSSFILIGESVQFLSVLAHHYNLYSWINRERNGESYIFLRVMSHLRQKCNTMRWKAISDQTAFLQQMYEVSKENQGFYVSQYQL